MSSEDMWESLDALNRTVNRQAKLIEQLEQRITKAENDVRQLEAKVYGTAPEEKKAA